MYAVICDSLECVCTPRWTKFDVCSTLAKDAYRGQSMVRPDDAFDETPVYAMLQVVHGNCGNRSI